MKPLYALLIGKLAEKLIVLCCGIIIVTLLAGLFIIQPNPLKKIESVLYDNLVSQLPLNEPSGAVTIVDIDDKSLAEIGQWPWPRYQVALLLEKLQQMQVLTVGIDFLFAEPDRTSLKNLSHSFQSSFGHSIPLANIPEKLLDNDRVLAEVLASGHFVTGYSFLFEKQNQSQKKSAHIHPLNVLHLYDEGMDENDMFWYQPNDVISSLDIFSEAINFSGFFNVSPDHDGIIRKVPLMMQYQGQLYPSLSLATILNALQAQQVVMKTSANGLHALIIDDQQVPIDQRGNFWIHFRPPQHTDTGNLKKSPRVFHTVSAVDILNNQVPAEWFTNRIVLIGTSARGLHDLRSTPYEAIFPGVEIHATIIDNIITGNFINHPDWSYLAQLLLIILAGVISIIAVTWTRAFASLVIHLSLLVLLLYFSWWYLKDSRIYLSTFYPVLVVILNFTLLTLLQYRFKERKLVRKTLLHNQQQQIALDKLEKAKSELEVLSNSLEQQVIERTQSLKDSEEKTRLLLTSAGEGIFGVDTDGIVHFINPAALSMLGFSESEILGRPIHSLIHHSKWNGDIYPSEECSICYAATSSVNATTQESANIHQANDEVLWRKNGSDFIAEYHARPIIKEGHITGAVITFNDVTEQRQIEIERFEMNKKLSDSIQYASLIQHSLIPDTQLFLQSFKDSFIIWEPKDVVGGDIYLFERLRRGNGPTSKLDDEFLLMVIDCTGHGVPGALVTMLVKAIEREIIAQLKTIACNEHNDVSPAMILSHFNRSIKKLLKQENKDAGSDAGFDGGVLYYNKQQQLVRFAGAITNLYLIEDSEIKVVKGNKHSIGYKTSNADYEFKDHAIKTKAQMQFYLTTDGFVDQKGGSKGFCFGKKRLQNILMICDNKPMQEQKEILLNQLKNYQGDYERNDDVTMVGFST